VKRERGEFLLSYSGDRISSKEGEKREETCSTGYRFFFRNFW